MRKAEPPRRNTHTVCLFIYFFCGQACGHAFFNKNKQNSNMIMASFIIPRRVHNTMPGRQFFTYKIEKKK